MCIKAIKNVDTKNKRVERKLKNQKGITLVALVVTIVVLLILAGITIVYVLGDNSVFKKAQDAKERTDEAIRKEQEDMASYNDIFDQYVGGNGGDTKNRVDVSTITEKVDKNTPAKDSLENPITIPAGFKVVPDGQDGVEYKYTGDKKPTVQDGIVIEDEEGNQFVWIPVGEIKDKANTTTTITLGRYIFDIGTYDSTTKTYNGTGKETLVQNADNYASTAEDTKINTYCQELETSSYGNTVAKSLSTFISKTKSNGGYYLARYEASYKDDTHCYSKVSIGTPRTSEETALADGMLWNYITQSDAAAVARNSFSNSNVESDLVNSYAWDTAIVFIQTYSGDSNYSKQTSKDMSLANTGVNNDKVCNIYEIASNAAEWTTETTTFVGIPCVCKGGYSGDSVYPRLIASTTVRPSPSETSLSARYYTSSE